MPVLTDCCWRVSAASSLFPALPSSLIDKAPSLTFTKCLFTKWEKFGSKTTRAESKGDLCSPQTLQKTASSSLSSFFFFISLAFHNPATPSPSFFFQIHFLSPHLFSKRLDWESGTLPPPRHHHHHTPPPEPSRWSINIQQSPEVQTGERLRRTAQHQSIMDFLLSFIRFLQGDAVEAPLAQNERRGGGGGSRGEVREGERERGKAGRGSKQCQ